MRNTICSVRQNSSFAALVFAFAICLSVPSWSDDVVELDPDSRQVLVIPELSEGPPAAGKRVKITPEEYAGTDVYHTVYLPEHWRERGAPIPIIFEYTGNRFPTSGSTGEVEDAGLGFGLSGGKFIWVSLPYISNDHQDNAVTWWGDTEATVAYAKKQVPEIISQFHADPDAVLLCGFSRGAIGVNFLGLRDDEIAKLWSAFITHDHFDGVKSWGKTEWGSPLEKYREQAAIRLRRVDGRPYLVCQNGGIGASKNWIASVLPRTDNFTFQEVDTRSILGEFPNSTAKHPHTDRWPLKPSDHRRSTWTWIKTVTHAAEPNRVAGRPNILYIVADDLGFSDLGCFGGEIHTPVLDSLAAGGVRLTQFYNTGRCCPSRAAILTGQYPHRVGLGHMTTNDLGRPGYRGVVSDEAQTIAQVLSTAGYRSFMSGKWHLGTPDPTQHGFEEFYGTLVSAKRFFDADHLIRKPEGRTAREYLEGEFYATDAVTDHAIDFLKLARDTPQQPWFLYLAYNAPHFPLHAPKSEIAKYADRYHGGWDRLRQERLARMKELGIVPHSTVLSPRSHWQNYGETKTGTNPPWDSLAPDRRLDLARRMAIYAAMIDRLDQQIGRVVEDLTSAGELENTLIVFTSDNGACFEWDPFGFDIQSSNQNILHTGKELDEMGQPGTFHSVGSGWANASNTPFRLYKHFNHEGGIASPGIVHWPSGLPSEPGSIHHRAAHIIDLLPTAIAVSGAEYDGELPLPGIDLINQINGVGESERTLFFEHQGNRAVRQGKWKLVALDDQPWELYDFTDDRTEIRNLANRHSAKVIELSDAWKKWAAENFVTPLPQDLGVKYLKPD